ncbi:MAG: DUF3782 domain-containing protein, partial [Archaeoglobaceae archaeon]|nr:DUF3782 domain-containing protein [Archaeoglobaceae archaeon]MDW8118491.1 DUF3782 domain-containing protein [Archaeoglobaceae archaeon]
KRVDEILLRHEEETKKLREDMIAGFRRHDEILVTHGEEIKKLREDMSNGFKLLRNQISAIGARWGIMSENAFRAGIKGIVEKEFGMKVERWVKRDLEGFVFGYPSDIELDMAISDGRIIIEIKSSISQGDVIAFRRKVEFYQRETGATPSRLVIVKPFADEKAIELAKNFGIEILNA